MSWNEPGGDKDKKDPWSGRDQQKGPPDLDEAIRAMQQKLAGLFGGGNGGDSPGGSAGSGKGVWIVLAVVLVIWALTGIYIVDEGNRGVVTRFGAYVETTMPGPHWRLPTPIERVEVVNVETQRFIEVGYRSGSREQSSGTVPREALMLTRDENIVNVHLAVQYQVSDAEKFLFNVIDPAATLKQVTESAERGVIGAQPMDFVLTEGRSEIVTAIKQEIQKILDRYEVGIRVVSVNLQDAQPPEEVQSAFEDAIKAREDKQRLINEAEAYSNEIIPKARGAAAREVEEAEAYKARVTAEAEGNTARFNSLLTEYLKAPEITRTRLYLDTMEAVLGSTGKVMVDVEGGNNLLYLPLDKMQGKNNAKGSGDSLRQGLQDLSRGITSQNLPTRDTLRSTERGREPRGR